MKQNVIINLTRCSSNLSPSQSDFPCGIILRLTMGIICSPFWGPFAVGGIICDTRSVPTTWSVYLLCLRSGAPPGYLHQSYSGLIFPTDRHQSIVYPFGRRITRSQGKLIMILIWLTALLPAFPMLGVMEVQLAKDWVSCGEFWPPTSGLSYQKIYLLCSFALTYAIPLPIMILIYIRIGLKLRLAIKEAADRPGFTQAQATKRIIKMLSAVVICYALCFLPFHTLYFMMDFGGYISR